MELPVRLLQAIDAQICNKPQSALLRAAQDLSLRYRTADRHGQKLITSDDEALAYCVTRMPATYGAVLSSLSCVLESADIRPSSLLDAGAGTGAAAWAAAELFDLREITCLEREERLLKLGESLMNGAHERFGHVRWINYDITNGILPFEADLVVASYVLNELPADLQAKTAAALFETANELALFVEPGTPEAFSNLSKIRSALLNRGAHIFAPCTHDGPCPLPSGDWCHFTCRIPRSRLHRLLKDGDAPFEDEKFSYLAVSKKAFTHKGARVLRHPQVRKGFIVLDACSRDGVNQITLSKKDGELYKLARKKGAGDLIT